MKRLFTIPVLLLLAVLSGQAQPPDSACFRIGLRSALGYGCFREAGASPLTYRGLECQPAVALEWERGAWRSGALLQLAGGAYGNSADGFALQAFGLEPLLQWQLWRRCSEAGAWRLYGGISLTEMFDLRYFSQLENSSVGMTNAVYAGLHVRAERTAGRWLLHGAAAFSPAAWMYRPGYAFISNYDRTPDSPLASTFNQYRSYPAGSCGTASELGAALCLRHGGRIGLAYRWRHFTSRTADAAPHRLDLASHLLSLDLLFQL